MSRLGAAYRRWDAEYRELPFGWTFLILFVGAFFGRELANALGGEDGSWTAGNIALYVVCIAGCIVLAQFAVRVLRRNLPQDHGGTAK